MTSAQSWLLRALVSVTHLAGGLLMASSSPSLPYEDDSAEDVALTRCEDMCEELQKALAAGTCLLSRVCMG